MLPECHRYAVLFAFNNDQLQAALDATQAGTVVLLQPGTERVLIS